jgi:6,7-dimethyl-8-ribityllumazine synthase
MKENVTDRPERAGLCVIALGELCLMHQRRFDMTHTRFAFVQARWHAEIVDQARKGFLDLIDPSQVDVFDVPGAFELPLMAQRLARSGRYSAIACAAFVVDGGIYRHDFVAQTVVDGLMRVALDEGLPVLSVSLTPHQFQETEHHRAIFRAHMVEKGREAARAALNILNAGDAPARRIA